jgi:heme-degrading monooxygenase HmoA
LYKQINENIIQKTENQIKKIIEGTYKRQSITKEMKGYFLLKDTRPGRVQGNPKVHKTNNPLRIIINGRHGG